MGSPTDWTSQFSSPQFPRYRKRRRLLQAIEALEPRRMLSISSMSLSATDAIEGNDVEIDFSATSDGGIVNWHVDWGNGDSSDLAGDRINALKNYGDDESGPYTITVTASDGGTDPGTYTSSVSASVIDADLHSTSEDDTTVVQEDQSFPAGGVLGYLDDDNPSPDPDDYSLTVDWGDGNSGDASIVDGIIYGSHAYAADGIYSGTVTVDDAGGSSTSFTFAATVTEDSQTIPNPTKCPTCGDPQGVELDPYVAVPVPAPSLGGFGMSAQAMQTTPPMARATFPYIDGGGPGMQSKSGSGSGAQYTDSLATLLDGEAGEPDAQPIPWGNHVNQLPHLVQANGGALIGVSTGSSIIWFNHSGSSYTECYDYGDSFSYDAAHHQYFFESFTGVVSGCLARRNLWMKAA